MDKRLRVVMDMIRNGLLPPDVRNKNFARKGTDHRPRRWFVRCDVDGFIDVSKPYGQFARATMEAQRLDWTARTCGLHSVVSEDWLTDDDISGQ